MESRFAVAAAVSFMVSVGVACSGSPDSSANVGADAGNSECAGKPDGAPCGSPSSSECDAPDTCLVGLCMKNIARAGAPCGDASSSECDGADSCDGFGACVSNYRADGTACGEPTSTDCTAADSCDGQGACRAHDAVDGTPCGDGTASDCDRPDTCVGGVCTANFVSAGAPCGSATEAQCDLPDSCDGSGVCTSNAAADGTACTDCAAGPGQCDRCSMGTCPDTTCGASPAALTTNFTGSSNLHGNMFDMVATHSVIVTGITVHPNGTGRSRVKVFITPDGTGDKLDEPDEWTEEASVLVDMIAGVPYVLPVSLNIPLSAGTTTGFYVTATDTYLRYTSGSSVGAIAASDASLQLLVGHGVEYPFGHTTSPRIFNGTLSYTVTDSLSTTAPGSATVEGQMFDIRALATTRLTGLDLRLAFGRHDVSVYFRPGSHVGFENDPSAWFPVEAYTGLVGGPPTKLAFSDAIVIPAGSTYALYVTSPTGGGALRVTSGTSPGAVTAQNGSFQILEGSSVTHAFGGTTGGSAFNGVVNFSHCP